MIYDLSYYKPNAIHDRSFWIYTIVTIIALIIGWVYIAEGADDNNYVWFKHNTDTISNIWLFNLTWLISNVILLLVAYKIHVYKQSGVNIFLFSLILLVNLIWIGTLFNAKDDQITLYVLTFLFLILIWYGSMAYHIKKFYAIFIALYSLWILYVYYLVASIQSDDEYDI